MRLRKMDDHISGRSKTTTVNPAPEYPYLRNLENNEAEAISSTSMIPNHYLQKVPDIVSATKNLNSLLNNSNDLMVDANGDLMGPNALDRYIPQEYEGDLMHDDLTDDDRRLAAALVAVQLVNQQKHQAGNNILPLLTNQTLQVSGNKMISVADSTLVNLPPLTGPNKSVDTSPSSSALLAPETSSLPFNQSGSMQPPDLMHALPPLKKVLNRSRYGQLDPQGIPLESIGIHTEMAAMDMDTTEMKTETIDFMLPDDAKDAFDTDSDPDYDPRQHSLPHKKRIPRRLRQPKKQVTVTRQSIARQCNSAQSTSPAVTTFTCELCFCEFTNQWKFFEHLKSHYEVTNSTLKIQDSIAEDDDRKPQYHLNKDVSIDFCMENDSTLRQLLTRRQAGAATTSPPRSSLSPRGYNQSFRVAPRLNLKAQIINRTDVKEMTAIREPIRMRYKTELETSPTPSPAPSPMPNELQDIAASSTVTLFECPICNRAFRRQKAFEVHVTTAHPRTEPVEEFSEPEDMMEGIRVQVVSDEEENIPEMSQVKVWCDEEDLYATEEDLTAVQIKVAEQLHKLQQDDDLTAISVHPDQVPMASYKETVEAPQEVVEDDSSETIKDKCCSVCNKTFSSRTEANKHIMQNHKELFQSIINTIRSKKLLQAKENQKKNSSKKVTQVCKECGKRFYHRNSLIYHLKSHMGGRDFVCNICGKGFYVNSALKVHSLKHTNVKPFKCEFCLKPFRQWGDLKYHVLSIHSNSKNYQCEICGKDFARKYSLTVHSRIHTGERKYKCEFCDKGFRASTYLQQHRRIHTGEKPHKCDVCGKMFRVKTDMKRHKNTHKDLSHTWIKSEASSNSNTTNTSPPDEIVPKDELVVCKDEVLGSQVEMDEIISAEVARHPPRLTEINANVDGTRDQVPLYYWQVLPS